MSDKPKDEEEDQDTVAVTLPGKVEKVIPPIIPACRKRQRFPSKVLTIYIERFGSRIL